MRRATSRGSRRSNGRTPRRSQAARVPFHVSTCCWVVAVHSQPLCWKWASIPYRSQNSPSSVIACSALRPRKRACSSLQKPRRVPIFGHQDMTKPPLRPEAPPPQTCCSSSITRASGSCSLIVIAVQSPTNPPPIMATSTACSPLRGSVAPSVKAVAAIQWLGFKGGVIFSFILSPGQWNLGQFR
ncbi:hypothetical protein D3C75_478070 [compost metagenome]